MNPLLSMARSQRRSTRSAFTSNRRSSTVREWPVNSLAFPGLNVSFGYKLNFPDVIIAAGILRIHGIGDVEFAETEVTLLAETCTVYAQCAVASLAAGSILVSASPESTSDSHYRFPLYTFTYNTTNESYVTPPKIHHFGDLQLGTPVM